MPRILLTIHLDRSELPWPFLIVGAVAALSAVKVRDRASRALALLIVADALVLSFLIAGVHCSPSCTPAERSIGALALYMLPATIVAAAVWRLRRMDRGKR